MNQRKRIPTSALSGYYARWWKGRGHRVERAKASSAKQTGATPRDRKGHSFQADSTLAQGIDETVYKKATQPDRSGEERRVITEKRHRHEREKGLSHER